MKLTFCIFLMLGITGCQELYEPDVSTDKSVLFVNGMLTDNSEHYSIHLQMASSFDSPLTGKAVSGATVRITDDLSHVYPFNESPDGTYISDSFHFSIRPDRKYTLFIDAADGNKYESLSQELIPCQENDSIYGRVTSKPFAWENENSQYVNTEVEGIETYNDFYSEPDQPYAFKFNVTVFIEYTYNTIADHEKYYAWLKYEVNNSINIAQSINKNGNNVIISHGLPFFPVEKSWYSLEPDLWNENFQITHWILVIDQFGLNEDSYSFYKKISDQLEAEGRIFDPLAVQINGNIQCINNPSTLVLGNFEISSRKTLTYLVLPDWNKRTASYKKIPNLPNVPDTGASTLNKRPSWWIN